MRILNPPKSQTHPPNYFKPELIILRATAYTIDYLILLFPVYFVTIIVSLLAFIFADIITIDNQTIISKVILTVIPIAILLTPVFIYFYFIEKNTNKPLENGYEL